MLHFMGISHATDTLFSHTQHLSPTMYSAPCPKPKSLPNTWQTNEHNCPTHSFFIWSLSVPLIIIHKLFNLAPSLQHQLFLGQHAWGLQGIYPSIRTEATDDFQRYFQIPPKGACHCHAATHMHHYQVKYQALLFPHQAAHQHWGVPVQSHNQDRAQRKKHRSTFNYKAFICDRIYEFSKITC